MSEEQPTPESVIVQDMAKVQESINEWQERLTRAQRALAEAAAQLDRQAGYLQGLERALKVIKGE